MNTLDLEVGSPVPKPPNPESEEKIIQNWTSTADKPLVSILCHCFNHENYIEDALKGFLMQKTDFAWEVIVHDDASTDQSVAVIKEYAERYPTLIKPMFQVDNQYSKGLKPTFFTSKIAKGKFFAFCEGDDYWLDDRKLQIQADFLRANPEYAVCGHDAFIFEEDKITKVSKLPEASKIDVGGSKLAKGWFILTLTAMYRSNFDIYPEEHSKILNGDAFLFSRLGKVGGYKYMPELAPGAYRSHSGGIWSLVGQQKRLGHALNSMFWISQYYKRVGDQKLSVYYARQSALTAFEGTDGMSLIDLLAFNYSLIKQLVRKRTVFLYIVLKKLKR
jgi:glycosyltransferase involved in cell wall biosynthesis